MKKNRSKKARFLPSLTLTTIAFLCAYVALGSWVFQTIGQPYREFLERAEEEGFALRKDIEDADRLNTDKISGCFSWVGMDIEEYDEIKKREKEKSVLDALPKSRRVPNKFMPGFSVAQLQKMVNTRSNPNVDGLKDAVNKRVDFLLSFHKEGEKNMWVLEMAKDNDDLYNVLRNVPWVLGYGLDLPQSMETAAGVYCLRTLAGVTITVTPSPTEGKEGEENKTIEIPLIDKSDDSKIIPWHFTKVNVTRGKKKKKKGGKHKGEWKKKKGRKHKGEWKKKKGGKHKGEWRLKRADYVPRQPRDEEVEDVEVENEKGPVEIVLSLFCEETKETLLVTLEELRDDYELVSNHNPFGSCSMADPGKFKDSHEAGEVYLRDDKVAGCYHRCPIVYARFIKDLLEIAKTGHQELVRLLRRLLQEFVKKFKKELEFGGYGRGKTKGSQDGGYKKERLNCVGHGECNLGAFRDHKGGARHAHSDTMPRYYAGVVKETAQWFQFTLLCVGLTFFELRALGLPFNHSQIRLVNTRVTGRLHVDTLRTFAVEPCFRFLCSPDDRDRMAFVQFEGFKLKRDILVLSGGNGDRFFILKDLHCLEREIAVTGDWNLEDFLNNTVCELNVYRAEKSGGKTSYKFEKLLLPFNEVYNVETKGREKFLVLGELKDKDNNSAALLTDTKIYSITNRSTSTSQIPTLTKEAVAQMVVECGTRYIKGKGGVDKFKPVELNKKLYYVDSSLTTEDETVEVKGTEPAQTFLPHHLALPQWYPHTNVSFWGVRKKLLLRVFMVPESLRNSPATTSKEEVEKLLKNSKHEGIRSKVETLNDKRGRIINQKRDNEKKRIKMENQRLKEKESATFVPGLGFSGFWYTLGRINSIPSAEYEKGEYYCFSAGCLAVSARFLNKDIESVARTALDAQGRWRDGELGRYSVATDFVDTLLSKSPGPDSASVSDDSWLPKVKVITTSWYGLVPVVTQARTREELKGLLIKTSFIPFATGFGLSAEDGEMDGGFSMLLHPRCKRAIYLPVSWDMVSNILN
ncbi:hypothetical protein TrRE_jg1144, partial [Triparma retinervis]